MTKELEEHLRETGNRLQAVYLLYNGTGFVGAAYPTEALAEQTVLDSWATAGVRDTQIELRPEGYKRVTGVDPAGLPVVLAIIKLVVSYEAQNLEV